MKKKNKEDLVQWERNTEEMSRSRCKHKEKIEENEKYFDGIYEKLYILE